MIQWRKSAMACFAVIGLSSVSPTRVAAAATPEEIDDAIARGIAYLYRQQQNGNWDGGFSYTNPQAPNFFDSKGGPTALVVWALLATGAKATDKPLADAIGYLLPLHGGNPYSAGLRGQVWGLLPAKKQYTAALARDRAVLLRAMQRRGQGKGLWHYSAADESSFDHSVSQFGVLGLWAAAEADIDVPRAAWQAVDNAWRRHQTESGGWAYGYNPDNRTGNDTPSLSMTAAGVATLFVTNDYARNDDFTRTGGNFSDPQIDRGMKWLARHALDFRDDAKYPQPIHSAGYALWTLERVALASGYKYFGDVDWYQAGATWLLSRQRPDGSWALGFPETIDTSFAILFLERGRTPLVMNKLQYDVQERGKTTAGHWNERPRDAANISTWIGKQLEREMHAQIVNTKMTVAEWHEAPILYIAGDDAFDFTDAEMAKLLQFVQEGGLIVGNPDGGTRAFAESFKKLGTKMFPTYEFRTLPSTSPIYESNFFPASKWTGAVPLSALSNGAREMMILLPESDPGRTWQRRAFKTKPELTQVMANIFNYVADRENLTERGQAPISTAGASIKAERKLTVARIKYSGNWNPEPAAWTRMKSLLHNSDKIDIDVKIIEVAKSSLDGAGLAYLTGATSFQLALDEQAALKKYVQSGGVLVVEATGGNGEFVNSARTALSEMFPDKAQELEVPLPPTHPLYVVGAGPLNEFNWRRYTMNKLNYSLKPRVSGFEINGKLAVIFSGEDLSTGLVGQEVDGVIGYDPKTATAIVRRIVLYAAARQAEK